jgi:hypothetical protein
MPDMKYLDIAYEIVKARLGELEKSDRDVYQKIGQALIDMSRDWYTDGKTNLQYNSELRRIAYVYGHMSANANLLEQVFVKTDQLARYFDLVHRWNGKVNICVFGSGPGTELLGVSGWLKRRELGYRCTVDYCLFEIVKQWEESLKIVISEVRNRAEMLGECVRGTCNSYWGEDADLRNFKLFNEASGHDIYIFPYVLSEVKQPGSRLSLRRFASNLNEYVKEQAMFIFLDRLNDETHTTQNISAIINGAELEIVSQGQLLDRMFAIEWEITKTPEFEQLRRRIDRRPRGQSLERQVVYYVAQKPSVPF